MFEIIQKALDARLYNLVMAAVRSFSADSNFSLCCSMEHVFKPKHWEHWSVEFAEYCVERTLDASECRAGMYMGNHQPDNRSCALAYLGLYFLANGNQSKAFQLWQAAAEPRDIDEAIAETCLAIAENNEEQAESALALTELISAKTIRAKTISELTEYF